MPDDTPQFTVVGAGLAGTLMACYLGKAGYRVDVYERRSDPRRHEPGAGRSINLAISVRGIQALREVGLADEVLRMMKAPQEVLMYAQRHQQKAIDRHNEIWDRIQEARLKEWERRESGL